MHNCTAVAVSATQTPSAVQLSATALVSCHSETCSAIRQLNAVRTALLAQKVSQHIQHVWLPRH